LLCQIVCPALICLWSSQPSLSFVCFSLSPIYKLCVVLWLRKTARVDREIRGRLNLNHVIFPSSCMYFQLDLQRIQDLTSFCGIVQLCVCVCVRALWRGKEERN
jgi:hypothetical protein